MISPANMKEGEWKLAILHSLASRKAIPSLIFRSKTMLTIWLLEKEKREMYLTIEITYMTQSWWNIFLGAAWPNSGRYQRLVGH